MNQENTPVSIPILNWFDDPIKQSVKSVFDGVNQAIEAKDIFKKYRRVHFRSLKRNMTKIKILGMDSPVELTDIYYPAFVSTTIFRRLYERDWHKINTHESKIHITESKDQDTLVSADKYVEEHDRVIILGGAGTGKTTLLRFLTYAYSDKNAFSSSGLQTSKFPIFISLPDLAKSEKSIEDYAILKLIEKSDKYASAFLKRVFKNGLAILLLDSLDEVSSESKSELIENVKKFSETYPLCSVVLSCRTADYDEVIEEFYEVELSKLTKKAVEKIVFAWFGNDKIKAKKLLKHLKNDKAIASLTETPLLLSLLCIQYRHDLSLPKRKAELYRRCVDALLRDWDVSRGFRRQTEYENLSDDRKERIYEHVAAHFFQFSPRYVFPEKKLIKEIGRYIERLDMEPNKAKGILKEIESHHGILEKISADSFGFSHPSIQEFFTAKHILSHRQDREIVKKYFENEEWASVIEFIVALREEPESLIQLMVNKTKVGALKTYPAMARRIINLWLLYRCLATGPTLSMKTYSDCYKHIVMSQVEIAGIYREGGVVPFAELMPDGVRHSYYYWNRRATLYEALQPLRKLANTIYSLPSNRYADHALRMANEISQRNVGFFEDISLVLCLVIPLSSVIPSEIKIVLLKLRQRALDEDKKDFFVTYIDESISNLDTH